MGRNILKQQEESESNKQTEKRLYSVSKSPSVFLKTDRKSKSVPWGFFWERQTMSVPSVNRQRAIFSLLTEGF